MHALENKIIMFLCIGKVKQTLQKYNLSSWEGHWEVFRMKILVYLSKLKLISALIEWEKWSDSEFL